MRAPLAFLLSSAGLVLGGCAKFPTNASTNLFTRLDFRITMSGPVNRNYIYIVAIQPIYNGNSGENVAATPDTEKNHPPVPIVAYGSNGIVAGYPTRYISYEPDLNATDLYNVYRFPTVAEAPVDVDDPNIDPDTPINPTVTQLLNGRYGPIISGTGINPETSGTPNVLGFSITTRDLADDDAHARNMTGIQFNIIAMNKRARTASEASGRVFDALGNQSASITSPDFNRAQYRIIQDTTTTYYNSDSTDREQVGDVYPTGTNLPNVDVTDWSMRVTQP